MFADYTQHGVGQHNVHTGLNVLVNGSGPSVYLMISAAAKASRIVLSDYADRESNHLFYTFSPAYTCK